MGRMMLDAFIIDELKRREREEREESRQRPALEIPVDEEAPPPDGDDDDGEDRGVIIIDL